MWTFFSFRHIYNRNNDDIEHCCKVIVSTFMIAISRMLPSSCWLYPITTMYSDEVTSHEINFQVRTEELSRAESPNDKLSFFN